MLELDIGVLQGLSDLTSQVNCLPVAKYIIVK